MAGAIIGEPPYKHPVIKDGYQDFIEINGCCNRYCLPASSKEGGICCEGYSPNPNIGDILIGSCKSCLYFLENEILC